MFDKEEIDLIEKAISHYIEKLASSDVSDEDWKRDGEIVDFITIKLNRLKEG